MNLRLLALAGAFALTAGCGTVAASGQPNAGSEPTPTRTLPPMPTEIPAAATLVRNRGAVTVLQGDGAPVLCLGGVRESLPPQCDGPVLVGWDWSEYPGTYEEASGVRWGEYQVFGHFDGEKFTVKDASVTVKYPEAMASYASRRPPCPAPDGGWRPIDESKATSDSLSAALETAAQLPGYAEAWWSPERNLALGTGDAAEVDVLSVRVTEDLEGAESELRKTWGGALCVAEATHSLAELEVIRQQVTDLPGLLTAGVSQDSGISAVEVEVTAIYDDGTLQDWADAAYGPDVVYISSALVPMSD